MISFGKIVLFIGCILSASSSGIFVNADSAAEVELHFGGQAFVIYKQDVTSNALTKLVATGNMHMYQQTELHQRGAVKISVNANERIVMKLINDSMAADNSYGCPIGTTGDATSAKDGACVYKNASGSFSPPNPLPDVCPVQDDLYNCFNWDGGRIYLFKFKVNGSERTINNWGGLTGSGWTINNSALLSDQNSGEMRPEGDGWRYDGQGVNNVWRWEPEESDLIPASSSSSNAAGDPHFKTFQDIFFSYHAACDILLLTSVIHEVMIQIRTTRVDTHRQSSYSYISQAAVKIQDVILEVSADGTLLINGEDSSDRVPSSIAGGYAGLTKTIKGTKRNIISYKVDLGSGRSIDLRSNTKTGMMYVDVDGHFIDSKGLLGPAGGEEGLYSRDGTIMDMAAEGSYNSYSQSWQVLSDEPMLFQEARFPQYPVGCSYTAATNKEDENNGVSLSPNLRRRLIDAVEVSKDEAMKACADAVPGEKKDFCVTDVMLTGDLDAAEDEFYYLN